MNRLEKVAVFARNVHAQNNDGHGFDHITRVVALAEKILLTEPSANRELVLCACYLHDTYDEKLTDNAPHQKALVSDFLDELFFDSSVKNKILEIIDNISFSANLTERKMLDINGQIVQDADRLDAMGALGIVRTLEYGWAHHRPLYNPLDKGVTFSDKTSYHKPHGSTVSHFYEKLFLLKDLLNTAEANRLGQKRDQIMHDFICALENESAGIQ